MLNEQFLQSLAKEDADFAQQVRRWMPKICNIASELSRTFSESQEDIAQDILVKMWSNIQDYRTKQVRWKKQIWAILEDGPIMRLRRGDQEISLSREECEPIQKASMGTFVYSGLLQFCADRYAKHYTEKNGYRANPSQPTIERTVLDRSKRQIITKTVTNYVKLSGESETKTVVREDGSELDEVDFAVSTSESPSDLVEFDEYVNLVNAEVSEPAKKLFRFLLQQDEDFQVEADLSIIRAQSEDASGTFPAPKTDWPAAARYFSCTRSEIQGHVREIVDSLPYGPFKDHLARYGA
jgi:hypothetical protein